MKKILLLAILILVSSFAWSKSFYAEDYYCRLNVRENGDIQVRETIQYRFIGGDFSSISRKIPDKYTDGLQFIRAFVKTPSGDIIQESEDAKITGSHLEVDWDFGSIADTLLNFEVEFIAKKVCYVENGMMYIRWQSVPESHEYLIKKGSVEMLLPRKIEPIIFLFSEDKRVECGYDENQIWWNFSDLKTNQNFVSGIALNEGSLEIEKPEWQALQEEAESLYVDFMRLGVVLVVLIAALLIYIVVNVTVLKKRYSRKDIDEDIYSVHPAMLLYLKQGFIVSNRIYIQIVIRLISKGMLIVKKLDNNFRVFLTDTETEDKLELELLDLIGKKVGDD